MWCVWRFFKKKRPKDKKKGKDGKEKVMIVEVDSLYNSGSFFHLVFFLLHYHKNFSKFHSETNLPSSLRRKKHGGELYLEQKLCEEKQKDRN